MPASAHINIQSTTQQEVVHAQDEHAKQLHWLLKYLLQRGLDLSSNLAAKSVKSVKNSQQDRSKAHPSETVLLRQFIEYESNDGLPPMELLRRLWSSTPLTSLSSLGATFNVYWLRHGIIISSVGRDTFTPRFLSWHVQSSLLDIFDFFHLQERGFQVTCKLL